MRITPARRVVDSTEVIDETAVDYAGLPMAPGGVRSIASAVSARKNPS
jgi:hypothetical protein